MRRARSFTAFATGVNVGFAGGAATATCPPASTTCAVVAGCRTSARPSYTAITTAAATAAPAAPAITTFFCDIGTSTFIEALAV